MQKSVYVSPAEFHKIFYRKFVIVADIGGTNTRVAILGVKEPKKYDIIFRNNYLTSEVKSIEFALNDALKHAKEEYDIETDTACLGSAGAIARTGERTYVKLTNTSLEIDTSKVLPKTMLKRLILINDFEAIGYGLDILDLSKDVKRLTNPESMDCSEESTMAVIGAGTGLGMAIVPYSREKRLHTPFPSEGGHMELASHDLIELELVHFLKKKFALKDYHPDLEDVVSGRGIENIYDFFSSRHPETAIGRRIRQLSDEEKIKMISESYHQDPLCKRTIDMFIKFYGRAARSLALLSQPYAGLFITGGIAQRHPDWMGKLFLEEFLRHEKKSDFIWKIPVYIITNPDVSLYGCCNVAVSFSKED
jgi:glucokinase